MSASIFSISALAESEGSRVVSAVGVASSSGGVGELSCSVGLAGASVASAVAVVDCLTVGVASDAGLVGVEVMTNGVGRSAESSPVSMLQAVTTSSSASVRTEIRLVSRFISYPYLSEDDRPIH